MSKSIKGLDKLQREIKQLQSKVEKVSGTRQVPISELLTPEFMVRFTRFSTIDEMLEQSGFEIESQEDFENIPDAEWDEFIAANTQFPTWGEMLSQAGTEHFKKLLEE